MSVTVLHADSRDALKDMPDASLDACVTDPPYALLSITKRFANSPRSERTENTENPYGRTGRGFMGQRWDNGSTAFDPAFWAEVLRVLKPGAHLIAFGGTRTYHRLVCAIEDSGFEIRDTLAFLYGSGFPKSHSVNKKLTETGQCCVCDKDMRGLQSNMGADDALSSGAQSDLRAGLHGSADRQASAGAGQTRASSVRDMRSASETATAQQAGEAEGASSLLQQFMLGENEARPLEGDRAHGLESTLPRELRQGGDARPEESGVEGWGNAQAGVRELQRRTLRASAGLGKANGASGRLHHGASASDGADVRLSADADGSGQPHRPQSGEQPSDESGTVALQSEPQEGGAWPLCRGCGKPILPGGLGSALKPAHEPIVLARKPLIGTIAANVLEYGTGALNINASRIAVSEADARDVGREITRNLRTENDGYGMNRNGADRVAVVKSEGRWPANVLHDGSEEVLRAFPESDGQQRAVGPEHGAKASVNAYGDYGPRDQFEPRGDLRSAARFFYTAKADADDRLGSKHPTVKPVDLMAYLVKLVTPPGGTVLDPFAGSGTTGMACMREGFNAILIEREEEYVADIKRRIAHVRGEDAPLFAEVSA